MGYRLHPRVPATDCSGRPQPGTAALQLVTVTLYPGTYDWGVYHCRTVRGGATLSHHAEGRAADLGIPLVGGSANRTVGDPIAAELLENAWELGIDHLIWNRRIWTANAPNGAPYTGSTPTLRHEDHIHTGQTWTAARNLTETDIANILEGDNAMAFSAKEEHELKAFVREVLNKGSDMGFVPHLIDAIRAGIVTRPQLDAALKNIGSGTADPVARGRIQDLREHLRKV